MVSERPPKATGFAALRATARLPCNAVRCCADVRFANCFALQ
jgi:hypothetical protein